MKGFKKPNILMWRIRISNRLKPLLKKLKKVIGTINQIILYEIALQLGIVVLGVLSVIFLWYEG